MLIDSEVASMLARSRFTSTNHSYMHAYYLQQACRGCMCVICYKAFHLALLVVNMWYECLDHVHIYLPQASTCILRLPPFCCTCSCSPKDGLNPLCLMMQAPTSSRLTSELQHQAPLQTSTQAALPARQHVFNFFIAMQPYLEYFI